MKLYSYYRSTAAYRVRIALKLKQIDYQQQAVNLLTSEQTEDDYQQINPQKLVPVLEHKGKRITQSMAILEYLEEVYPEPSILPKDTLERATARSLANVIACDIHPLNNLRVLKYLVGELAAEEKAKLNWYRHWIEEGFQAFEKCIEQTSNGKFCLGDRASIADILLIPQVYNAHRFEVDMQPFPLINSIETYCLTLPDFAAAIPENQPDAPG